MNDKEINITVDHREARCGVVELLEQCQDVAVSIRRLQQGDYLINNTLLIERKTLPDLVKSIKDGRLFSQALRLQNAEQLSMIILEGTSADIRKTGMRREAIQGALIMLTLYLGIPLIRSRDLNETVQLMRYAARQGKIIVSGALPRRGRRMRGKRAARIKILQGFPGIGPQRAGVLLDRFGSIEKIIAANESELTSVEGIGAHIAHTIRSLVEE